MGCVGLLGVLAITASGLDVDWNLFKNVDFLEVTRPDTGVATCSAVRIKGKNIALTSAHCVAGVSSMRLTEDIDPKLPSTSWVSAPSAHIHPEYDPKKSLFENDIAVVCLPETNADGAELWQSEVNFDSTTPLVRIGWGERSGRNARDWTDPQKIKSDPRGVWITDDMNGVRGDSGGPLITKDKDGKLKVIGIHSTWDPSVRKGISYAVSVLAVQKWINSVDCSLTHAAN